MRSAECADAALVARWGPRDGCGSQQVPNCGHIEDPEVHGIQHYHSSAVHLKALLPDVVILGPFELFYDKK